MTAGSQSAADGQWIQVPEKFTAERFAVPTGSTRRWRVIVDVPVDVTPKHLHAEVVQSCGDPVIDIIAVEYVGAILRANKKIAANIGKHVLGFQLELNPTVVVVPTAKARLSDTPADAYITPYPPYPYEARARQQQGLSKVRVIFGPLGRPQAVVILASTGVPALDTNTMSWVLGHWYAPVGTKEQPAFVKEVAYSFEHKL